MSTKNNQTLFPSTFIDIISKQLPNEHDDFFIALTETSYFKSIRYNPQKNHKPIQAENKVNWCDLGEYKPASTQFTLDPLLHAGAYYVQEASSMFLSHVISELAFKEPVTALDLCAAPGGKSTLIASALPPNSALVANEVIKSRVNSLNENSQKWGTGNVIITNNDPSDFGKLDHVFDLLVIDAPCSGEGMFRKDKDSIKEWSLESVTLCSNRQSRIIADSWNALKPGGFLIYSTCTFNESENDAHLKEWVKEYGASVKQINVPKEWNIVETPNGGYQFYPHKIKGEGFFISILQKPVDEIIHTNIRPKNIIPCSKAELSIAQPLLKEAENWSFFKIGDTIRAFPRLHAKLLEHLAQRSRVIFAGIELGEIKQKDFIPAQSLATSIHKNSSHWNTVELDTMQALQYLKKSAQFSYNGPSSKGWTLFTYLENGLGWAKVLPNRINNYYPAEWCIRMEIPTKIN